MRPHLEQALIAKGFEENSALTVQFAAFLLAPVGPLLGVWSSERWQRKRLIVGVTLLLGGALVLFGATRDGVALTLLAAAIVLGCNWFSTVFHAY